MTNEDLEAELRETRKAVQALAAKSKWQQRVTKAIGALFLLALLGGYMAVVNARHDRDALRDETCHSGQVATRKARNANEAMVNALVGLADPKNPQQVAQVATLQHDLNRQQDLLLSIPKC